MSIFDYDLVGVIQHKSSNGQCTNPLIRFDLIGGLAVGFVIAYPMSLGHDLNAMSHRSSSREPSDENQEERQEVHREQEGHEPVDDPKQP